MPEDKTQAGANGLLDAVMDKYIIYVDDDDDDRLVMEHAFEDLPEYELLIFDSGTQLIDFTQAERQDLPALIILDINLLSHSGLELLALVRKDTVYTTIPVVMFTTSANPADRKASEAQGAKLVTKPASYQEMIATCKSLLDHLAV